MCKEVIGMTNDSDKKNDCSIINLLVSSSVITHHCWCNLFFLFICSCCWLLFIVLHHHSHRRSFFFPCSSVALAQFLIFLCGTDEGGGADWSLLVTGGDDLSRYLQSSSCISFLLIIHLIHALSDPALLICLMSSCPLALAVVSLLVGGWLVVWWCIIVYFLSPPASSTIHPPLHSHSSPFLPPPLSFITCWLQKKKKLLHSKCIELRHWLFGSSLLQPNRCLVPRVSRSSARLIDATCNWY